MARRNTNLRLKLALLEQDISQLRLALDLSYDPSYVSKVLRGWERPSRQFIHDVAAYLQRPACELFNAADIDRAGA